MKLIIRKEKESDIKEIFEINKSAFGRNLESKLVDMLRIADCDIISLVAEFNGKIVGHIMFSPVYIDGKVAGMGLAPLAVLPEFQKQGIGTKLINAGIEEVKKNYSLIILFGHETYYPKFGFVPASKFGLKCQYKLPEGVSEDVFMAMNFTYNKWNNKTVFLRDEFKISGFDEL